MSLFPSPSFNGIQIIHPQLLQGRSGCCPLHVNDEVATRRNRFFMGAENLAQASLDPVPEHGFSDLPGNRDSEAVEKQTILPDVENKMRGVNLLPSCVDFEEFRSLVKPLVFAEGQARFTHSPSTSCAPWPVCVSRPAVRRGYSCARENHVLCACAGSWAGTFAS